MKHSFSLKRLLRAAGYLTCGGLATAAVLTIAAVTPRQWQIPKSQDCKFKVYVSGGPMHTNLFVPVQNEAFDWRKALNLQQGNHSTPYRYLQFGWGDRIFYTETLSWDQVSIPSALRALFLQNLSAVFVKGHPAIPQYPNEQTKCVTLNQSDYLKLMAFIQATFEKDQRGSILPLGKGQDGESEFYAATGHYSMLKTCNSWTADALRAANVNTPVWGGLAPAVMHQIRNGCECDSSDP